MAKTETGLQEDGWFYRDENHRFKMESRSLPVEREVSFAIGQVRNEKTGEWLDRGFRRTGDYEWDLWQALTEAKRSDDNDGGGEVK